MRIAPTLLAGALIATHLPTAGAAAQTATAAVTEAAAAAAEDGRFYACYVPEVGAVYLIKVTGLPEACLSPSHVEFSWSDGLAELPVGAVTTAMLADGAVIASKLANGSVVASKLADGAVTTGRIADGAVTLDKLAPGTITGVADGSIHNAQLAANAVTSDKILDGSIGSADVAANSLTAADLAAGSVESSELASNAVGSINVMDNSLTGADLAAGAVGNSEIAANAVGLGQGHLGCHTRLPHRDERGGADRDRRGSRGSVGVEGGRGRQLRGVRQLTDGGRPGGELRRCIGASGERGVLGPHRGWDDRPRGPLERHDRRQGRGLHQHLVRPERQPVS
jgi:hypothetical protein